MNYGDKGQLDKIKEMIITLFSHSFFEACQKG
jgi:hypothetical protein